MGAHDRETLGGAYRSYANQGVIAPGISHSIAFGATEQLKNPKSEAAISHAAPSTR